MSSKKIFKTDKAPAAIGPYSQAVESQGLLFCSGQIPLDPSTHELIASSSVEDQARRVMDNIKALLEARGLTMNHVVKTTIFLKNISDFAVVNEIYGSYFTQDAPARSTVEVARLPKDVLIEIETIASL